MKIIAWFLLVLSTAVFAQESVDVSFLVTQRTLGSPFSLPISVNTEGEISLFGASETDYLSFRPSLLAAYSKKEIEYSHPVSFNQFNFYPVQKELGWIDVKRRRLEIGAGLSTILQSGMVMGLVPYKGSMQTIIQHKASSEDESLPLKMPAALSELENWNSHDSGTFQTYGGITAFAGFSMGVVKLAKTTFGLQNQFIVDIKKLSPAEVTLKITEESLERRQLELGPLVTKLTFAHFEGRKFSAEFTLDMTNPEHHTLFEEALKGNLTLLQESLPFALQNTTWEGHDRQFYYGIPVIAAKIKYDGHYDFNEDGVETELDFKASRNRGIFTPHRLHQDFVYQTSEGIVVIWSSEMNKTNEKIFKERFLSKGRIMGIRGFDRDLPDGTKLGSVVSQIGIQISRKEIAAVTDIDMEEVALHLKERCEQENLSCRKTKRLKKIVTKIKELLLKPWLEMRGELGLLLLKEPAIIHAVVKTMKYKKEVYFKFLSEKYQSLEGSSPIEF